MYAIAKVQLLTKLIQDTSAIPIQNLMPYSITISELLKYLTLGGNLVELQGVVTSRLRPTDLLTSFSVIALLYQCPK